jgi:hypothetical protein
MILNKKELKAVIQLQKLAKSWPKSLWLFCNGTLYVMKKGISDNKAMTSEGGYDPKRMVCSISGIDNDGGDW